jgi:hypothetical protein
MSQPDQAIAEFIAAQRERRADATNAIEEMAALLEERQGLEKALAPFQALAKAVPTSETFAARVSSLSIVIAAINERLDSLREVVEG